MNSKRFKKLTILIICVSIFASFFTMMPAVSAANTTPSNPNASQGAKNLLYYLNSIMGNRIIGGQYNYASSTSDLTNYTNQIYSKSGKYAGLWGSDWSFYNGGWTVAEQYQGIVDVAKQRAAAGEIVSLMWHMPRPDSALDTAGWGEVQTWIDDTMANNMITSGTTEYSQMIARIDAIVPYMKQLRDAGVTVLWRPYHEMNYGFFWWGARPDFVKELWKIMYNRYTNYHGLNNLLWVWNVNNRWDTDPNAAFANYYPGSQYVDITSIDIYGANATDYNSTQYNEIKNVDTTKVIALGENGIIPDADFLINNGLNYAYFMTWGNWLDNHSDSVINSAFNHEKILTRDELSIVTAPSPVSDIVVVNDATTGTGNNQFEFVGGWQTSTGIGRYNSDDHYALTTNDYYNIRFYGQRVKLYTSKASHHGIMAVSIDGGTETNVDLYSAIRADNTLVYTTAVLTPGQHTIKVRVTGTKNASSTGTVIVADRADDNVNLIKNPEFNSGITNWSWSQSGTASGSIAVVTGQGMSGTNALKATMTNGGADTWNAQINQNFPIISGKIYKISFRAKAAAARTASLIIQQNAAPYSGYWMQDINLTTTSQVYGPCTFTCNNTDAGSVLRFNIGGSATAVFIDQVVITQ